MIPQYPPIVSTDQAPQTGALDALAWAPRTANRAANIASLFAIILLFVGIWAYATRPTAAVSEAPRTPRHNGQAHIASASTDTAGGKDLK